MSHKNLNILAGLSFIPSIIALLIFIIWIDSANMSEIQAERVEIFYSRLPSFLRAYNRTSLFSIVCLMLSIILSSVSMKIKSKSIRILLLINIIFSILLMMLNIFGMM